MRTVLQEYEKELKQEDIQIVDLETKDADHINTGMLEDDLTKILNEELKEIKQLKQKEIKDIFYSLNYCQKDGFMFKGTFTYKQTQFIIKQKGHYYHSNSKKTILASYKNKCECELNKKQTQQT